MAETYRKSKIETFLTRLEIRKKCLINQLQSAGFEDKHDFLQGQVSALDLVMTEIEAEFELLLQKDKTEGSQ
jgi:hypothetical protein